MRDHPLLIMRIPDKTPVPPDLRDHGAKDRVLKLPMMRPVLLDLRDRGVSVHRLARTVDTKQVFLPMLVPADQYIDQPNSQ